MLRDKYEYKFGYQTIDLLEESLSRSLNDNRSATNPLCGLALLALVPFVNRLDKVLRNPKMPASKRYGKIDKPYKYKVHLKQLEAAAFAIAFKYGFINTHNHIIVEIFTEIDRTL